MRMKAKYVCAAVDVVCLWYGVDCEYAAEAWYAFETTYVCVSVDAE